MMQGDRAEALAKEYLIKQGLTFVEANVRYSFGEIDLIMREQQTLIFVEVKYRASEQFGGAINALSKAQIQRIRKAASHYLQINNISPACRFDLMAISPSQTQWITGCF
ncbi:YraN family protein [Shewanella maritima]|uniref:YraN family protein n=1 Tax=Shewanella maritima TaxID=2520507 RepID=UPI003735437F